MNTIKCPNCQEEINVDALFEHQFADKLRLQLAQQKAELNKQYLADKSEIESKITSKIEQQLSEQFNHNITDLREQLTNKSNQVESLKKEELSLRRQRQELTENQKDFDLKLQRKLDEERIVLTEQLSKEKQEEYSLKLGDKEQIIEGMRKQIDDLKRKAEQGSMQIQGETQEIKLENLLSFTFPTDSIEEIKKGANGADVIHTINNQLGQHVGKVAFESKRTKAFSIGWIDKLKLDMQASNSDVGILVTETMPVNMSDFGLLDGVWVCKFNEVKGLASVIRESLLQIAEAKASQVQKGDKMSLLYDFLTSNEFKFQIQGIVEGFSTMKEDLDREKRAMTKLWKAREKQLDKVLDNTIGMYGSIKGLAGNAIITIPSLELDQDYLLDEKESAD